MFQQNFQSHALAIQNFGQTSLLYTFLQKKLNFNNPESLILRPELLKSEQKWKFVRGVRVCFGLSP
jgi:hypothetical protein